MRDGQELDEIVPFKPLQVGDEISVLEPEDDEEEEDREISIRLVWNNGEKVILTYENASEESPYQIEDTYSAPSVLGNVMNSVSIWFNKLWSNFASAVGVGTKGRGESTAGLTMPLLEGDNQTLIAGERVLYLAWHGGEPPYRARVYRIGADNVLWDEANIKEVHA
ncbi:MAG: hypothetical protein DRR08_03800 [Candidatus Parabeggiatoa sp. nov. 2]|nr:MAG: hypothetical protein B6247_08450 [Beggiatoa sp. 4572_84]RKZ63326.1 MAG: hypothetical protein DRR08_03800 [Gammaproteobacteria bacterium]HEC84418.1 hypothetical protein [Thioploca sp.]